MTSPAPPLPPPGKSTPPPLPSPAPSAPLPPSIKPPAPSSSAPPLAGRVSVRAALPPRPSSAAAIAVSAPFRQAPADTIATPCIFIPAFLSQLVRNQGVVKQVGDNLIRVADLLSLKKQEELEAFKAVNTFLKDPSGAATGEVPLEVVNALGKVIEVYQQKYAPTLSTLEVIEHLFSLKIKPSKDGLQCTSLRDRSQQFLVSVGGLSPTFTLENMTTEEAKAVLRSKIGIPMGCVKTYGEGQPGGDSIRAVDTRYYTPPPGDPRATEALKVQIGKDIHRATSWKIGSRDYTSDAKRQSQLGVKPEDIFRQLEIEEAFIAAIQTAHPGQSRNKCQQLALAAMICMQQGVMVPTTVVELQLGVMKPIGASEQFYFFDPRTLQVAIWLDSPICLMAHPTSVVATVRMAVVVDISKGLDTSDNTVVMTVLSVPPSSAAAAAASPPKSKESPPPPPRSAAKS